MKALLAISVSREWVETEFLKQMYTWRMPSKWQIKVGWFNQFTAAERHNMALMEGFYNYDRVLFLDTDQIYPDDYIEKMLAHEEPVVTGLNVSRYHPYEFTIYDITGESDNEGIIYPTFESVTPPSDRSVFECDMTGTGAMMVDTTILKDIDRPFFKDIHDDNGCYRFLCDDFYFAWQLNKKGIRVTVDTNIVVKHIAKINVSPYNAVDLQRAWDKVNSGWGITKDGRKA